jgi:hypothetical protein
MEKLFVNNNFSYVELVPVSNGSSWAPEALARDISNKFRQKNYPADLIVVWLDLEKQACGSAELSSIIEEHLVDAGADRDKVCVCVPDRMTENIILADQEAIKSELADPEYIYSYEGKNGKVILKDLYMRRNVVYRETSHGVRLLKKIRIENSAATSPTAKKFYDKLSAALSCWWLVAPKATEAA